MITLPESTLKLLGERIALANNGAFLWRKLAESPTIQNLSTYEKPEALETALRELLANDKLTEEQQTLAYCLLTALLLQNPMSAKSLAAFKNIDQLYLARSLLTHLAQFHATTERQLIQPPITAPQLSVSSSSTQVATISAKN